jgi:hypothetical protein
MWKINSVRYSLGQIPRAFWRLRGQSGFILGKSQAPERSGKILMSLSSMVKNPADYWKKSSTVC